MGQFSTRQAAVPWIPWCQEQAQQLYIGAGRLSKPGPSQGWLGHVWAPNGSSATCSRLWVYTLWPCSSLETCFWMLFWDNFLG